MATPLGYCVQFRPCAGKDTYADIGLGLGASVVAHLVNTLFKLVIQTII